MGDALLILALLVVATIAFRRRGVQSPVRWSPAKAKGSAPARVTWAERMHALRLASRFLTALILVYFVVEVARRLFG